MSSNRRINFINLWAVKSANRKKIADTCAKNLIGLKFDSIYTPDYGLCLETVLQINRSIELTEIEITLTERFRDQDCIDSYWRLSKKDKSLKEVLDDWEIEKPEEIKSLQAKLTTSFRETAISLINKFPKRLAFNILVITDETIPLLEILGLRANKQIRAMKPGDVTRIRLQLNGDKDFKKIKLTPIHAVQWSEQG